MYQEGSVFAGPLFVLRARRNGLEWTRWGFAVGKRLERRAVGRNRLRRQLRAAAAESGAAAGWDLVVTARAGALRASYSALRDGLRALLLRAGASQA